MSIDQLSQLAHELRELTDQVKELEGQAKTLKFKRDQIKNKLLPEAMEAADQTKFSVEGVGTVYLTNRVFAHINAADREAAYSWFRDNGHGDLIKETVHTSTLNAWAKEQLEEGGEIPESIQAAYQTTANLRSN
jgi:hypothetical protein